MKLISDYRVRMSKWLYFMIIPLLVYYLIFNQFIYSLTAGGIIFFYWTMFYMFVSRYIKVIFQYWLQDKMGLEGKVYLKTLKPKVVPSQYVSATDIQKIEGYPVLMLMAFHIILIMISYASLGDDYLTKVLLGGFILSFNTHYSNFSYIKETLTYPNANYLYNKISVKIFEIENKHVS